MLPYIPNTTLQEYEVIVGGSSDDNSEDENQAEEPAYGNFGQSQYAEDTKKRKMSHDSRRVSAPKKVEANISYDSCAIDPQLAYGGGGATGLADVRDPLDPAYNARPLKKRKYIRKSVPMNTLTAPTTSAGLQELAPAGSDPGVSTAPGSVPYFAYSTPTAATRAKATKPRKNPTPRAKRASKPSAKAKATTAITQANLEQTYQNMNSAQSELLPAVTGFTDPALNANTTLATIGGTSGPEQQQSLFWDWKRNPQEYDSGTVRVATSIHQSCGSSIQVTKTLPAVGNVDGREVHQPLFGGGNPNLLATNSGPAQEFAAEVTEEAAKLVAQDHIMLS